MMTMTADFIQDQDPAAAARLAERVASLEKELAERRRAEQLQRALYEIAALSSVDSGQHEHYAQLHEIVGRLMSARNFIISTYDAEAAMIHQVYLVDEDPNEVKESFPFGEGISSLVLRSRQPWLLDNELFSAGPSTPTGDGGGWRYDRGTIQSEGRPCGDWRSHSAC